MFYCGGNNFISHEIVNKKNIFIYRMNEQIKQKYLHRDRVVRALSKSGTIRVVVVKSTQTVLTAQEKHSLDPLSANMLGRVLSGASLLASFLKGEERIVVQTEGSGVLQNIYAEAMQVGEVRGYVRLRNGVDNPLDHIEHFHEALGAGFLKVTKFRYNSYEPTTGIVELVRGDITSDLALYLTQSEQIPSGVRLDVLHDDNGNIIQCGGVIAQVMPGATDSEIEKLENLMKELPSIGSMFHSHESPDDIIARVLPDGFDIISTTPLDFYCRCSLDRFKSVIQTLGIDEVRGMKDEGQNELLCQYCSTKYHLSENDFDEMITALEAERN